MSRLWLGHGVGWCFTQNNGFLHPHAALNYTKCWDPLALWLYVASQLQMLPCQEGWLVLQPFNRKPCVTWLKSFACYLFWLGDFQLLCVHNMEAQRRKKEREKKKDGSWYRHLHMLIMTCSNWSPVTSVEQRVSRFIPFALRASYFLLTPAFWATVPCRPDETFMLLSNLRAPVEPTWPRLLSVCEPDLEGNLRVTGTLLV